MRKISINGTYRECGSERMCYDLDLSDRVHFLFELRVRNISRIRSDLRNDASLIQILLVLDWRKIRMCDDPNCEVFLQNE